ncbi:hypothetical protein Sjap_005566 [Stephania japonica]|uniref:Heat shock protein 70 n=1 Tax=Stephania japonica TaxID=461633 RepID=A0AAP0K4A4_9MAGN
MYRGVPQIEVSFEVDANGILHVQAQDKALKKFEKITITNDKGRLSGEIDRMVAEAEEFAVEDKKNKERIESRNSLENYVYSMKNQINDKDKLAEQLKSNEKEKVEMTLKEALEWMDDSQSAEKEEYDEKLKEVQDVCHRVVAEVYLRDAANASAETKADDH